MFQQDITLGPGTGTFTTHTFEIFIMLFVAFLMGLWMGWALWNRFRQMSDRLRTENDSLTLTVNNLRAELETLRGKVAAFDSERSEWNIRYDILERENTDLRQRLSGIEQENTRTRDRNLQLETELGLSNVVEQDAAAIPLEINTDAPASDDDVWVADPETELAGMAVEEATAEADLVAEYGDALPAFQLSDEPAEDSFAVVESADQGTETADEPAEPVKEEAPAVVFAAAGAHRDDLKIVEGIGPKIEELLFQNGVYTYQQLAETPVEDIRTILNNAGSRFAMHDPGTWSAQALLAANGEWDNLKAYQDFLNAGKRPGA
ncbi:MAG: hypothetical protein U0U46_00440 [Saprospiraceae bacterium]